MNSKLRKQLAKKRQLWLESLPVLKEVHVGPVSAERERVISSLKNWGHIEPEVERRLKEAGERAETSIAKVVRIRVGDLGPFVSDPQTKQVFAEGFERGLVALNIWEVAAVALSMSAEERKSASWVAGELEVELKLIITEVGIGVGSGQYGLSTLNKNDHILFKLPG